MAVRKQICFLIVLLDQAARIKFENQKWLMIDQSLNNASDTVHAKY